MTLTQRSVIFIRPQTLRVNRIIFSHRINEHTYIDNQQ